MAEELIKSIRDGGPELWTKLQSHPDLGKKLGEVYTTDGQWRDMKIGFFHSCWIWLWKRRWQITIFRELTPKDKEWNPVPRKVEYYL